MPANESRRKLTVGDLFSGVGGFSLGLERAGFTIEWQSEIEPYCCDILKKHWPNVPNLGDIYKIKDPPPVDLICGGFPCQPFSVAGKRKGKADDRYVWPEMLRVIAEVKPRWVFAENVPGIIHMELDQVLSDLEGQGYYNHEWPDGRKEIIPLIIPACALNAPHRRSRVWIPAYNPQNPLIGRDGRGIMEIRPGCNGHYKLRDQIAMLPTPKAWDGEMGLPRTKGRPKEKSTHLATRLDALLPTPRAEKHSPQSREDFTPNLAARLAGKSRGLKLQPAFVEWMMGFPLGFTDIGSKGSRPSATQSSHRSQKR